MINIDYLKSGETISSNQRTIQKKVKEEKIINNIPNEQRKKKYLKLSNGMKELIK